MSKILCFVFAVAILGAAVRAEFVPYTSGSPTQILQGNGKGKGIPNAPKMQAVASGAASASTRVNPYESLVARLAQKVGGLSGAQTEAANAIIAELHSHLTNKDLPTNFNLAAYLLATAYADHSLLPSEEQLKTDDVKASAMQAPYFKQGTQGRGYVHFSGAYNYNRFARDVRVAIDLNPKLLLDKKVAAKVLVFGVLNGRFTGVKIDKFIPAAGTPDFAGARRAVNGDVNAVSIAKLAASLTN